MDPVNGHHHLAPRNEGFKTIVEFCKSIVEMLENVQKTDGSYASFCKFRPAAPLLTTMYSVVVLLFRRTRRAPFFPCVSLALLDEFGTTFLQQKCVDLQCLTSFFSGPRAGLVFVGVSSLEEWSHAGSTRTRARATAGGGTVRGSAVGLASVVSAQFRGTVIV